MPPPGSPGSGICDGCPARVAEFSSLGVAFSESSLAFQRSCGSLGPFTEKDDEARGGPRRFTGERGFPRQGHQRAGFSEAGFSIWERDSLFGNSPLPGSGIPPPGSPGSGIFDRVPRRGCWGAEFSPAGVLGSGVFPRQGQVQGVKGHSILHCTPWLAGILRSVDSICWQGADLEAVAFSCTGRRLARTANGLGSSKEVLSVVGVKVSSLGLLCKSAAPPECELGLDESPFIHVSPYQIQWNR